MKIHSRDFIVLALMAMCIMSQIVSQTSLSGTSADASVGTNTGLLSNIGLNNVLSAPLSITNNLIGSTSASGQGSPDSSSLLNLGTGLNLDPALNTVNNLGFSTSNLLGSVTSDVSNLLGATTSNLLNTVGSTVDNVGTTLDQVTSGVSLPLANVGTTVSTTPSTSTATNTQLPLLTNNGLPLDPVLNTVGTVLDPILGASSNLGSVIGTTGTNTGTTVGTTAPLNLGSLPVNQLLNTVTGLGSSLPIVNSPTSTLIPVQVSSPINVQPLLSTLVSTVTNLLTGLLGTPSGTPAFYVDSSVTSPVTRIYDIQGGYIDIEFDFRVPSTFVPSDASLVVLVDNVPIYRVLASQSGKRIRINIPVIVAKGKHSVGFFPLRGSASSPFSFYISNLFLYEKQIFPQLTSSFVVNGGFEANTCASNQCVWTSANLQANFLTGWNSFSEINIVRGNLLTSALSNSWAVRLDVIGNTCIVQNMILRKGKHLLKFLRAATPNSDLSSNSILLAINRQIINTFTPVDFVAREIEQEFFINTSGQNVEVILCAAGASDGVGSLIDNVSVQLYDQSSFRINRY